ncbi:serine hydrolase [Streptomyces sp. ME02-8801-2C]|uniref:serine hydrolase n=1 Tax=Streptomyces sp. ME02-8801-2C TaxID=3028680 RepID=UPI0029B88B7C|nr:serine hydrolase [Streptomyces sp. ME02-8801-2C]MDX3454650.1 serine hydrolase [Streptomyces sp. ME02-8801-2C]
MTHRTSRSARARILGAAAVCVTTVLALLCTAAPVNAAPAAVSCTSAKPALATKLKRDITSAIAGRRGSISIGVYDRTTKTTCAYRAQTAFDSASVVKVTVLSTLLWDAQKHQRALTAREKSLSTAMITKSDNAATTTLWNQLGLTKIRGFLTAAGMTQTKPGANGYWGLTQITARDETKLLQILTLTNRVLTDNSRAYVQKLMSEVVASQRWGTPKGVPSGVSVHVKNGWLQRASYGWRVHSIGTFKGRGHDYMITVLTHGNSTWNYGITTIEGVAKVVHRDLMAS